MALGCHGSLRCFWQPALLPQIPCLRPTFRWDPRKPARRTRAIGLTSEAGFNDGLAFPFVNLAIALGLAASTGEPWVVDWITYSVMWEVVAGIAGGWLVGRAFGWVTFHVPADTRLAKTGDGLIAIAATFISYGLTEMIQCYGFLAVFVTALTLRHSHRDHAFHRDMHDITEQVERLAMMVLLLLFGGALVTGLLTPLRLADVFAAVVILLIIRPAAGLLGLIGLKASWSERLTLAFFGIRGVGSFYDLAYGLNHMEAEGGERLWAIVGLVVLLSILLHRLTVTPIMRTLDRLQGRDPDAKDATPPPGLHGPGAA